MNPFSVAHAVAEDWTKAVKACVDGLGAGAGEANLGFVYATDVLADDFNRIVTYLRHRTGIEMWVGSVGMGICAEDKEYFDRPAVAVMTATLGTDDFAVFPTIDQGTEQLSDEHRAWIAEATPTFGVVHGDPDNAAVPGLIETLAAETSAFLTGGITSSRTACHQVAGRVTGGGLSGVLFSPRVEVATGLSQGCVPVAESHVVSDCLDNVVISLDGRSALDVFKEDVGKELADDLSMVTGIIHAGIPVAGSDTGDYTVRELLAIDPQRGWLAIGGQVEPGDRVMFVRRDTASAVHDLEAMLAGLERRLPGPPRGGLYFSCLDRGPGLFGEAGKEMAMLRRGLGRFPIVGFFGGGEICNGRLYTHTGVLVVFF